MPPGWRPGAGSPPWLSASRLAPRRNTTPPGSSRVAWLAKHRATLAKKPKTPLTTIDSYNVPNCPAGKPRAVLKVATAPQLPAAAATVDCTATGPKPTTDFEAFNEGYAALSTVPVG